MIVVSDTTPLIALMKISLLDVLESLFGEILIPEAVYKELTTNENFKEEAEQIEKSSFIKQVSVKDHKVVEVLRRATGLDLGESEAIAYADDAKADFLLMDEVRGRKIARSMGLQIMGSVGILLAAYEEKILTQEDVEFALEGLKNANQRIGDEVIAYAKKKLTT